MWDKGEYAELYNKIKLAVPFRKSMLSEVKRNYYLYKIALNLGDNEKADEHSKFIIQNGGNLWYRHEILKTDEHHQ